MCKLCTLYRKFVLDDIKKIIYILIMENITISENIKLMAARAGLSLSALARLLDDTPQNFTQKLKRDNFRVSDLEKIADICGYSFTWDFIKKD